MDSRVVDLPLLGAPDRLRQNIHLPERPIGDLNPPPPASINFGAKGREFPLAVPPNISDIIPELIATIMDTSANLLLGWPTQPAINSTTTVTRLASRLVQRNQDIVYATRYASDGHLITFAPTGSGKGVSVIIPNLLNYAGPTIVIDPKGENFAVTAPFRRRRLGHRILLLDPFRSIPDALVRDYSVQRDRLNPLDLCLISEISIENDAQMLADLLSGEGSLGNDPFWDLSARKLLSGLIAHEMQKSRREQRPPSFDEIIATLFGDDPLNSLDNLISNENPTPFVRRAIGGGLLGIDNRLTASILVTAQSYLASLTSGDLLPFLNSSTIDIRDLQTADDYTLYIVIPPNKLESHSYLLKLWIGELMHAVMERKQLPTYRTLFMLDECANLGELSVLRKAVTLLRGYGLQVWMFFQDLSQLRALYEADYRTMLNNCGVLQAFGIGRLSAAGPLAKVIGEYKAEDLLHLDRTQQVLSLSPGKVQLASLMKYYADPAFASRFASNPLNPPRGPISNGSAQGLLGARINKLR